MNCLLLGAILRLHLRHAQRATVWQLKINSFRQQNSVAKNGSNQHFARLALRRCCNPCLAARCRRLN
uniref:Putative secreted protein n=1 Tax=Anopheles darlingi TaxID=43151 RepID=A0A2M4D6B8_ANODA